MRENNSCPQLLTHVPACPNHADLEKALQAWKLSKDPENQKEENQEVFSLCGRNGIIRRKQEAGIRIEWGG